MNPGLRSRTSPLGPMRKWSGITWPQTTASPSPQLASTISSCAPLTGLRVNITPARGIEQRLYSDTTLGRVKRPTAPAVRDGRVGIGGPPDLPNGRAHVIGRGTLSNVRRCPAKLASAPPRRPQKSGPPEAGRAGHHVLTWLTTPSSPLAMLRRPRQKGLPRGGPGDRPAPPHPNRQPSTQKWSCRERPPAGQPRSPEDRHFTLVTVDVHAGAIAEEAGRFARARRHLGIPYSRATMAACERRPPRSVTIAPSRGNKMLKASEVDSVTSTSPFAIRSKSLGPATRRTVPS